MPLLERLRVRLADWIGLTPLNQAVQFMLLRDLNVLSGAERGQAGHAALREAFLHLLPILKPTLVCDIGALDGTTALAAREAWPNAEVHAFEANPRTHAEHARRLRERGIAWHNIAMSDRAGTITVHAPTGQHAGKTSVLLRSEKAEYDDFEVPGTTLDHHFQDQVARTDARFALWIDVEGAGERVLAGAPQVLARTLAVFIECEGFPFWQEGSSAAGVAQALLDRGFVPLARDREYGDKQFNALFVAGHAAHRLAPALFDASSPLRRCLGAPHRPRGEANAA